MAQVEAEGRVVETTGLIRVVWRQGSRDTIGVLFDPMQRGKRPPGQTAVGDESAAEESIRVVPGTSWLHERSYPLVRPNMAARGREIAMEPRDHDERADWPLSRLESPATEGTSVLSVATILGWKRCGPG